MKWKMFINSRKLSWTIVGVGCFITFIVYFFLPDKIPMHFNSKGVVDDYSGKIQIFLFPVMQLIIMFLSSREKIKYCLTHSKTFLSDVQYHWLISGLCFFILLAEGIIIKAIFG